LLETGFDPALTKVPCLSRALNALKPKETIFEPRIPARIEANSESRINLPESPPDAFRRARNAGHPGDRELLRRPFMIIRILDAIPKSGTRPYARVASPAFMHQI
jgi:hypothetical protein